VAGALVGTESRPGRFAGRETYRWISHWIMHRVGEVVSHAMRRRGGGVDDVVPPASRLLCAFVR
jgi:hypothetical protein